MRSTVEITSVSRICIPALIRKELGIDGGDAVEVTLMPIESNREMTITAKVFTNGRIHVPKKIRNELGVSEGDLIEIAVHNGGEN